MERSSGKRMLTPINIKLQLTYSYMGGCTFYTNVHSSKKLTSMWMFFGEMFFRANYQSGKFQPNDDSLEWYRPFYMKTSQIYSREDDTSKNNLPLQNFSIDNVIIIVNPSTRSVHAICFPSDKWIPPSYLMLSLYYLATTTE